MSSQANSSKYFAFISYSRKDSKVAAWLQKRLEWFRFPVKLVPEDRRPPNPKYVRPVYRDKTNLEVTDEHYWTNIRRALEESRFLIVLCSQNSAKSEPVNMEVKHFLEFHGGDASRVVPVIVGGNVVSTGDDAALCPALRGLGEELINRNLPTMVPDADIAAQDAWESGFVALSSYLLQLERNAIGDHIQRESRKQATALRLWLAGVIVLGLMAVVALWYALEKKKETERQLEYSQLEEGRAWLERAQRALGEKDPIAAQIFAARSIGLVDDERGADELPNWKQKYPALLGRVFSDPEAERMRLEEAAVVKDLVRSISPTCLPIWSSPMNTHHKGAVTGVAFNQDGSLLASGGEDSAIRLWDVSSGEMLVALEGHSDIVTSVAFSPDGSRLATASMDDTMKLWDVATGTELVTIDKHSEVVRGEAEVLSHVTSVAFSPDGSRLASGACDKMVKLWDVATGEELTTLPGHEWGVISVAFSPDGSLLASLGEDGTVKLWDVKTDVELAPLQMPSEGVTSVAFSPDGSRLATGGHDVKLWDLVSGEELTTFKGHSSKVNSVAFSPDGSRLATGSGDQTVKFWDVETGKELARLQGHSNLVTSVAFSPDGSRLASASADQTVKLWNIATGKELASLEGHSSFVSCVVLSPDGSCLASGGHNVKLWDVATGKELASLKEHSSIVTSVAFSPDGSRLASGLADATVKLWDVASGKELDTLEGHSDGVTSVAFSPDGRRLASGASDKIVKLWDVASGNELDTLKEHSDGVSSVAFSPDGSRLASGSWDDTVKLWHVASGEVLRTFEGHSDGVSSVAFSPDGSCLASGGHNVKLWDVETGNDLATLYGHSGRVCSVVFSLDGSRLASGANDKTVKIWDVASGKESASSFGTGHEVTSVAFSPDGSCLALAASYAGVMLWDVETGNNLAALQGHSEEVTSVAFSLDGRHLASGARDKTVKLWDVASGKELASFGMEHEVTSVAFSPDGSRLASGARDRMVKLWDVASGKELATYQGHTGSVFSVAFSPDGSRLASGAGDKTVKLWDVVSRKELKSLEGHSRNVTSVAFSPDGSRLASGAEDMTLKVWDVASGKELATFRGHAGSVFSVAFSPDGNRLASGARDRMVKLWDVAGGEELITFKGHSSKVNSVAFSRDGSRLASGSEDELVKIWDLASGMDREKKPSSFRDAKTPRFGGKEEDVPLAALIKGIPQLEQKGYLELIGREVDWCTNDSLFSSRSFEPLFWRQDLLARIAAAETDAERWRLRLQLCGKGGQWRALLAVWAEARRSGLDSEEEVRHEFVVQALIAARALLSQAAPQPPESLWQALLESTRPEDWRDPRFALPFAQAVPAVLTLPDAVDELCQTLIRKVLAEAPVTWLEAVAEDLKSVAEEEPQAVTARRHDFLRSAADRHPSSAILLRTALVTHAETAPERLAMEDRLLLLPGVVSGDFTNAAYGAAQRGDAARTKRLLEMALARFDADETVHRMAGWSYLNLADPDAARKAFEAARERLKAERKPNADLLAGLAISQWQTSDWEAAVVSYKALIETGRAQDESKDWTDAGVVIELMATEIEKKTLEEVRQATLAKFPELRN